ncbi:MAG: glycine betaine ABC transporter substrate-binding protein [Microlunatus sp.]|nr:glycine betaine ABC transporter substrate-binding protein [Microlunatus sp.]MDN5770651.1 glycine betaine ABC transporter substrate-binding protein [Microlunatus sp.]
MKKGSRIKSFWLVATVAAVSLTLVACGSSNSGGDGGEGKSVIFGVVEGWTDQTSTTALLSVILQDNGYTTKTIEVSDNDPLYKGLAEGKVDVLSSSWLEQTHEYYWDKYGKDITDLGTYYEGAADYLAAPTYSDLESISDLPAHAAELNHQIIGIEPGAGLTRITKDSVIPAYGLTDFNLVLSTTDSMIKKLREATEAKQPIVVTLWRPFWANDAFPVRPLKDPKGAYGSPEGLHPVASKKFAASHPEVANMLAHFTLTDRQYETLEATLVNDFPKRQRQEGARAWLKANPGFEDQLASYLKKQ